MTEVSARLELPYLAPAQAQKHVTHNEALQRLDALTQLVLEEVDAASPPAVPVQGALYALGSVPTQAWAGQAGQLAYWDGTAWLFLAPSEGWRAWDKGAATLRIYQAGAWVAQSTDLQNVDGVGVGTGSDAVNRLAVASAATLLTHDGAGHQLKVNKAAASDTASLLYQSDWTGHAEMGLTGATDFHIKTSPDGTTWRDSLVAEAATGRVHFPNGLIAAPARAYVTTTTSQPLLSEVKTFLTYENLDYDTDGFYDPAFPDRLSIPEDGGYRLAGYTQLNITIQPGEGFFNFERFDSAGTKLVAFSNSLITGYNSGQTPVIQCSAGDFFRVMVRQQTAVTAGLIINDPRNFLSIERVF